MVWGGNIGPQSFLSTHNMNRKKCSSWIFPATLIVVFSGCSTPIYWVHESSPQPSCIPNRLPTWDDYSRKKRSGNPSAETAVRFYAIDTPPQVEVRFDFQRSWVKPELGDPLGPVLWRASEQLLLHEQLHFLISCLLTRQANQTLQNGSDPHASDPHAMVKLVKAVAQRLNLQYDKDTNHGLNRKAQAEWEEEILSQLNEVNGEQKRRLIDLKDR